MARLIPQKQIEEVNIFRDSISVGNSVFISGSLLVSQSIDIGNDILTKQRITGSVEITGSLNIDGNLSFANADSRLDATASFAIESIDTQLFGGTRPEDFVASEATIYVSSTRGSDDNDGRSPAFPLRTIKKAAQLATPGDDGRYGLPTGSLFTGYRIDVDTGTYIEDNPIELPRNTTVWGSGLRVTKIVAKNENEDLFWVNSGCYLAEMTFAGLRVYPSVDDSQKGFAIAFAPNAFITTSPYIQNCSMISNQENSFLEAYEEIPAGGGGLNVDGNRIHPDSPLASMVLDAYTQIAPNGVGCQVVGRGFIQLVSFFTNFSAYSVKVLDGGQAVLLNSNTSFGDYGMYASGSRFITGSGGNTDAFLNVQDNYSIIVNTIEKGLSSIPALVPNTQNGIRVTDPNIIPQYFLSEDSSAEVAEAVKSDFRIMSSIVENGISNVPTLIAKSSTNGYSPESVYNISGQSQYTSSASASSEDLTQINTNFDILMDIIERGNAATSSYVQISNVSHSIKVSDIDEYTSLAASEDVINNVNSSFDIITSIITSGVSNLPTIVSNTSASYVFSGTSNYETDVTASAQTIASVSASLSIVYTAINEGTSSLPTIIPSSSIENPSVEIQNAYELLINNIPFIQDETITYLSSSWSEFSYNQTTCKRDISFIVSGAAHDLLYGGNEESVRSGLYYYLFPSNATTTEKDPTLTAVKFASGLITNILTNREFREIEAEIDDAYNVIFENKDFVTEETIAYISSSWSNFDYNEAKCRRDVGYIMDAVATDLKYEGNERSVKAGEFYYLYPSQATVENDGDTGGQLNQTLDAINYAKRLTAKLLNADTFTFASGSTIAAVELMRENRTLIQNETITYINTQYPNLDYNEASCSRDVGYIIDNISTDLLYGGNERTEIAGLYYFLYPSVANTVQLDETLNAIEYVKGLVDVIVTSELLPTPQVVLNIDGNIKVTTFNSVTASVSGTDVEATLVSQSFGIIEDIIRYGTDSTLSAIAGNSNDYVWNLANPLNVSGITQITSSESESENFTNLSNNFEIVTDIIGGGTSSAPTTIKNIEGLVKVTNTTQFTNGSSTATSTQANKVSSSIEIVSDIVQNGTGSLPSFTSNTNGLIKVSSVTQITSASSADTYEVTKVSSSFDIVTDIVENGLDSLPTIESNTSQSIKVTDSVQYISSSYSGSLEDVAFISASISIVTNIISNGTGSLPTIVEYTQSLDSENIIAAYEILKNNISFIQNETIAYLSSSWSTASYDEAKCRRDVGLIISGAAEDLLWGANSSSVMNGYYYYLFPSQAQGAQLNQTLDGVFYASKLAQKLIQNIEFESPSVERIATWDLITQNTEFIQEETIAYLSSSWSTFDYNEVTCKRDVGYILDAVKTDVLYGGNERTAKAGEFYYLYPSQATVGNDGDTGGQLNQTLDGIRYAGRIAESVIQNTTLSLPSQAVLDAKELLVENKQFIKDETIAFISSSWNEFSYNQDTCKRDVGYILDAAITDLVYGGNERSRIAAEYYFRYPSSAIVGGVPSATQQKDPTVDGINYVKELANKVVLGNEFVTADTTKVALRNSIVENKTYIQQNVLDYINDTYSYLNYNQSKCYRDIGFIVDAVVTDLVYGGNERSIKAGTFYYLFPSPAIDSQRNETIDGINFGRDLVKLIEKGAKSVEDSFDVVVKIIESGSAIVTEQTIGTDSNGAPISTVGIPKNSYGDNLVTTVVGTIIPAEIELVKNTEAGIRFESGSQYLSETTIGSTEIQKVSSSFSVVTDIIKYGIEGSSTLSGSSEFVTYYEVVTFEQGNYLFNKNQLSKFDNAFTESFEDGIIDPPITLKRGELYTFSINSLNNVNADITDLKPFYIKTKRTAGSGDLYNQGITNNGTSFGTLTFIVPFDAPDELYYVNGNDSDASGMITVVDELPISDTQRYIDIPSLGEVEVITNNVDNIKVTDGVQYISQYTASVSESLSISSSFATTIDILTNGIGNLPTEITNVSGLVKKTELTQYTSSVDVNETLRNNISSSYAIVLDIVKNGVGVIPTLDDNTSDLVKVTSEVQYTSEINGSSTEVSNVSSSFAIVLDILRNGVDSLPTEVLNIEGNIKKTDTPQYISASSAQSAEITKISSSFSIVTDIISNGVETLPTIEENITELIKVTDTEQFIGSLSGSLEDIAFISSSISIVTNIIANGLNVTPTASLYVTPVSTDSTLAAYEILQQNIDFIQNETIAYLSSSWSTASYDEAKCRRDIGYIVSGAAEDLIWNTVSASVINGRYYYEIPSQAEKSQLNQTLDGIFYASKLAQQLVQNNIFVTASSERVLAADLLKENTEFIKDETIAYLSSSWSTFDYNEVTCKRDVNYILDAVRTDIVYGGNERSVNAGVFYYRYPSDATGSQLNQTIDGIVYASRLANKVVQNIEFVTASQIVSASYDLIKNNVEFVKEETIAYLSSSWSTFDYNEVTCKRDVGYIIDAVATDLYYGGNERSITAGEFYYLYPSQATGSQINQTADGVNYARRLVQQIVQSNEFALPPFSRTNAYDLLIENKSLIQAEAIAYVSSSWSGVYYNEASCSRDVGYIVDAVATDTLYGGNERSRTAGEFYYLYPSRATNAGVPSEQNQLDSTLSGINYARLFSNELLQNNIFTTASTQTVEVANLILQNKPLIQSEVIAYISSSWSNFEYNEASCSRDVGYILDAVATDFYYGGNERSITAGVFYYLFPSSAIVSGSESPNVDAQLYPTLDGVTYAQRLTNKLINNVTLVTASVERQATYDLLFQNKSLIQDEVIHFMSSSWSGFEYIESKCKRDVGYIIDAVATDTLYGGNERSVTAGEFYYLFPSEATTTQSDQTITGVVHAAGLANKIIQNELLVTASADVIANYNLILDNKELVQDNVIEFVDSIYPYFTYNRVKCRRDVGFIIDAIATDLLWGGNERSIIAGDYYYRYPSEATTIQLGQTTEAIRYAKSIVKNVLLGNLLEVPTIISNVENNIRFTNTIPTTGSLAISGSYLTEISSSFTTVIDVIENGLSSLPIEVKNIGGLVKVTNATQTTSSNGGSDIEVGIISASIDMINDIIRLGSDSIPFAIAKNFQTSELDTPQNLTTNRYVTASEDYEVGNELAIVSSSFLQINDIIENGLSSLPTLVLNTENNIKVTNVEQFTSLVSGSQTEIQKVSASVDIIETIVQNGVSSIPTIVQNNTNTSNLIKVGNVEQYISASGADRIQSKIVSSSFGIVIDILVNGTGSLPSIVEYGEPVNAPKSVLAYELLKNNIEFIKEETILFMSSSWSGFEYNEASCSRDVGLIVSGAAEDLIFNSNSSSIVNGYYYYLYPSAATGSQLDQTVTAIRYASNLAQNIVRNYEYVTASAEVSASYDLLIQNKELIVSESIEFVSSSWSDFYYNQNTCGRDVRYIVDAVATDLLYGGNERSVTAGRYYYDYPSSAIVGGVPSSTQQKDPTVTAINYVKGLVTELVGGSTLQTASNEVEHVYDALRLNRGFIQSETIAFVNAKYPNLFYNEASCSRDTGFIVDAVATDLRWGGNQRSREAGRFYYLFPSIATSVQLGETTDAIVYASNLVNEIVSKNTLFIPTGSLNTDNGIKVTNLSPATDGSVTDVSVLSTISASFAIVSDGILNGTPDYTPTTATYNPANGEFEMTIISHSFNVGDGIYLMPESFTFTCEMDGNRTEHNLPSVGQPAYNTKLQIVSQSSDTITVNVGASGPNVEFNPTTASYNPATGDFVVTVASHSLSVGEGIVMEPESFAFTCEMDNNQSIKSYPRVGIDPKAVRSIPLTAVTDTTLTFNVGASGPNKYFTPTNVDYNALTGDMTLTVSESFGLGVGRSVVLENESFAFTCDQDGNVTTHSYPRSGSDPYAEQSIIITSVGTTSHTVTDAPYDSVTGDVTITIANHGFSNGDYIKLDDNSLTYTCVLDGNTTTKSYPRPNYDYPSGRWLEISNVSTNTFDINIGSSPYVGAHTFVSATTDGLERQDGTFTINVGNAGSASGSIHTFVSASQNAVKHEPQSIHTFVSASNGAIKHLPQSAHTFVRTEENSVSSFPPIFNYGSPLTGSEIVTAYGLITASVPFIQAETIAYLSSSWVGFEYNEASCSRDVGFIVSGVASDLLYGVVSASVINAKFYYEFPSEATGSQLNQTLDGIRYAAGLTNKIIQGVTLEFPSTEASASWELLRRNKQFIQSESIAYISSSWSNFSYNEETCKRDIGYILDAIATDIKYGGNERSVTAGDFYHRYPSNATTSELEPTTTGIEYAGDLAEKVIVSEVFQTPSSESIAGKETLIRNRAFIQNEVIAYISSSWSNFEYNEASCSRDTGYIVDAVATDLLYGGNERSRTAGEYYYKFPSSATVAGVESPNVNAQLYPTLDGVKYASGIAQKLVQNTQFVTASNEVSSSWNLLRDNKEFIQNEVIAYVSSSWSNVYYNEDKCKRDVGYLIDAAATDLYYGGNERSVTAGSFYYLFPSRATVKGTPSEAAQLDPTIDGIIYAAGLSQKVIKNTEFVEPSAEVLVGADLLIGNKSFIQTETILFLSSSWSEFEYNEVSCSRDIGYLIDAARTDLVYGGNERSIKAGTFYYYIPSVATTEQKPQTIDGIDFAKGMAEKVINKQQLVRPAFQTQESLEYLRASKKYLQSIAISYTAGAFPDFVYNEEKCYRDTGFIVDAIATDLVYGGNQRSIKAAESYYTGVYGSAAVVITEQKKETAETNRYLRTQFQRIVRNSPTEIFGSLIITTGHDFSYSGAGVTYKALPPNQGGAGVPDPNKEITELAGGRVFFTSGNELGDFRIGTGLVINQATGTLQGRTFSRSLFSLVTPFSLALEG